MAAAPLDDAQQAKWDDLTAEFLGGPEIALGPSFGRISLLVRGKLFASAGHGGLMISVPEARVRELVDSGLADPFASGAGRVMREWAVVHPDADWSAPAAESLAFVRSKL